MNRFLIILVACFALLGCDNPFKLFQSDIKICDLYEKQSVFADSIVCLHQLRVVKCSGLFSISCADVTDGQCTIKLFTTKPYAKDEIVDIKARYKVIFNYNGKTVSALVTDDFPLR